jgi:hypothetical protein
VAGGGLTVIANAPNPAGFTLLKDSFDERAISAWLFVAALAPTAVAIFCFRALNPRFLEIFDRQMWAAWLAELDRGFLFLLLLPFVVALIGIWAWFTEREK